jgi:hypothetical protein
VTKFLISLVLAAGALVAVTPAQSQQQPAQCPPGQARIGSYCQNLPRGCDKFTSKLQLRRATFNADASTIDIFALISRRASGRVKISLQAAGKFTNFTAAIDSRRGRIRTVHGIPRSQAEMGTGILTITYDGDADTRPQVLRVRAANNKANLTSTRPRITATGFLRADGTVTKKAKGVVRVQLEFVNSSDGLTVTLERSATINSKGRWSLNAPLSPSLRAQIAARCGTLHSYVAFTGYLPENIRGESKSFQVLPAP